jgi:hypothetical protein
VKLEHISRKRGNANHAIWNANIAKTQTIATNAPLGISSQLQNWNQIKINNAISARVTAWNADTRMISARNAPPISYCRKINAATLAMYTNTSTTEMSANGVQACVMNALVPHSAPHATIVNSTKFRKGCVRLNALQASTLNFSKSSIQSYTNSNSTMATTIRIPILLNS